MGSTGYEKYLLVSLKKQITILFIFFLFHIHAKPISNTHPKAPVDFEVSEAYLYLYFSYSAFCPWEGALKEWNCTWCKKNPDFHPVTIFDGEYTNAYGYVGFINKTIVVAFRGTQGIENIIVDAEFWTVSDYPDIPGASVHRGFFTAYQSVRQDILEAINKIRLNLCSNCDKIVCTGHSLGAALSGFCGTDLALYYKNESVKVYVKNFGMPRIGDKEYAKASNQLLSGSWRMVHHHDIVPQVPPSWVLGYHHIATEIWNDSDGTNQDSYVICDSSGEDPKCADSINFWQYDRADHMIYMGIHNNNCHPN